MDLPRIFANVQSMYIYIWWCMYRCRWEKGKPPTEAAGNSRREKKIFENKIKKKQLKWLDGYFCWWYMGSLHIIVCSHSIRTHIQCMALLLLLLMVIRVVRVYDVCGLWIEPPLYCCRSNQSGFCLCFGFGYYRMCVTFTENGFFSQNQISGSTGGKIKRVGLLRQNRKWSRSEIK